jgi:hypothetical protein
VIEVIAEEEPELPTESKVLTISLHTSTGIHPCSGKTMQLLLVANSVQPCAFLDSDSTHNFIDLAAVERVVTPLQGCADLCIVVANDGRLTSLGCCHGLSFYVAGEAFHVDCRQVE